MLRLHHSPSQMNFYPSIRSLEKIINNDKSLVQLIGITINRAGKSESILIFFSEAKTINVLCL